MFVLFAAKMIGAIIETDERLLVHRILNNPYKK